MHLLKVKYFLLITTAVIWMSCEATAVVPPSGGKALRQIPSNPFTQQLQALISEVDTLQVDAIAAARETNDPNLGGDTTTPGFTQRSSELHTHTKELEEQQAQKGPVTIDGTDYDSGTDALAALDQEHEDLRTNLDQTTQGKDLSTIQEEVLADLSNARQAVADAAAALTRAKNRQQEIADRPDTTPMDRKKAERAVTKAEEAKTRRCVSAGRYNRNSTWDLADRC